MTAARLDLESIEIKSFGSKSFDMWVGRNTHLQLLNSISVWVRRHHHPHRHRQRFNGNLISCWWRRQTVAKLPKLPNDVALGVSEFSGTQVSGFNGLVILGRGLRDSADFLPSQNALIKWSCTWFATHWNQNRPEYGRTK